MPGRQTPWSIPEASLCYCCWSLLQCCCTALRWHMRRLGKGDRKSPSGHSSVRRESGRLTNRPSNHNYYNARLRRPALFRLGNPTGSASCQWRHQSLNLLPDWLCLGSSGRSREQVSHTWGNPLTAVAWRSPRIQDRVLHGILLRMTAMTCL